MISALNLRGSTKRSAEEDATLTQASKKVQPSLVPSTTPAPMPPARNQNKNAAAIKKARNTPVSSVNKTSTIAKNAVIQIPSGPSAGTPSRTLLSIEGQTPVPSGPSIVELGTLPLEPPSPVTPRRRRKIAVFNQRPPVNKTWEIFGDQDSTDYLSSAANMAEYKIGCRYFHSRLALIARGFSIDEIKNIFHATMPPFLEEGEDYERKQACRMFEDEYDWVTDKLIERICGYASLWIETQGGQDYKQKYINAK